ncbi:MAG: TspO and MBR [Fimbriimonadales bacterium]
MAGAQQLKSAMYLAGWVILCFGVAAVGSRYMPGEWYESLAKPDWNPPNWVFAPVWTVLYLMMATAAWRVTIKGPTGSRRMPLLLFVLQLLLNGVWSWLFFGLRSPGLAFTDIVALWVVLLITVACFWRADRLAGLLLIPYFAWVSFALTLNLAIWTLNP